MPLGSSVIFFGANNNTGHPITDNEGSEGEQMYGSTLPSTSALDGGGWSKPRPSVFTPGKDPVPIVQEAGWAPGLVWTGAENLSHTGIRSPDRQVRSKSLYRLSYRDPVRTIITNLDILQLHERLQSLLFCPTYIKPTA